MNRTGFGTGPLENKLDRTESSISHCQIGPNRWTQNFDRFRTVQFVNLPLLFWKTDKLPL